MGGIAPAGVAVRFGIVGGGMLGMTVAWNVVKAGHQATIFEAAPECGGLASPWQVGDVIWDRHYHVTLHSDVVLRALLSELGLQDELRWVKASTGFFVDSSLYPFSSALDYLRFPPLSPIQKVRLGATILKASRIADWLPLEDVTAVDWLARLGGRKTVERIWLPLLRAKLGPHAERASAAFIWAIIARMYAARRTGSKRELFGYVRGGYRRTLQRFEAELRRRGVEIRTSCPIRRIEPHGSGIEIASDGHAQYFDRTLVTLVPPIAARLCPTLTDEERARCLGVEYQGIVCASLLCDAPLTPYYITNIAADDVPFTAVIEMTALVDPRELGGRHLIYLPKYVPVGDAAFGLEDRSIESSFLSALERMHPTFRRESVRAFRVSRVPYVFPIPTLGYSHRLPPVRTATPGLFMSSSAHIVNGTLNVNETVALANRVSTELIAEPLDSPTAAVA
jgi:protoporphyrinogen oxidase